MIAVNEAEQLVSEQARSFGTESVLLNESPGRVLAESIIADRDYPAGNRSTMDGIAIKYASLKKRNSYRILATQPAGAKPVELKSSNQAIQLMTGSILGNSVDTVVRVEDLEINGECATISVPNQVEKGQFVHRRGADLKQGEVAISAGDLIGPKEIAVLANLGYSRVNVKKLPVVLIVTTGNELVAVNKSVKPYQVRQSNGQAIAAILADNSIKADVRHLPDDKQKIKQLLKSSAHKYNAVILTGGVSKGEYDYVQFALSEIGSNKIFHGVTQRPGKPFWFGSLADTVVFAFPGNAVSCFMCTHRYFVPWLRRCLGLNDDRVFRGKLSQSLAQNNELTRFIPVKVKEKSGELIATPLTHNGSGDFISLVGADAFAEVPKGSVPRRGKLLEIWRII